ncbi:MAG TPA: hypothetical protein GXZ27_13670 [Thermoanaerobacterales bacterium]|jgi:hypothetical protein|nr:hypothetical protein [Thermoanaerobacterales bacterium]
MKKHKNLRSQKKKGGSENSVVLKGFFRGGENYVPHLSRKEKVLARILEEIRAKKDSKD